MKYKRFGASSSLRENEVIKFGDTVMCRELVKNTDILKKINYKNSSNNDR